MGQGWLLGAALLQRPHLVAVQQLLIKGLFNQDSQLVSVQVLHHAWVLFHACRHTTLLLLPVLNWLELLYVRHKSSLSCYAVFEHNMCATWVDRAK